MITESQLSHESSFGKSVSLQVDNPDFARELNARFAEITASLNNESPVRFTKPEPGQAGTLLQELKNKTERKQAIEAHLQEFSTDIQAVVNAGSSERIRRTQIETRGKRVGGFLARIGLAERSRRVLNNGREFFSNKAKRYAAIGAIALTALSGGGTPITETVEAPDGRAERTEIAAPSFETIDTTITTEAPAPINIEAPFVQSADIVEQVAPVAVITDYLDILPNGGSLSSAAVETLASHGCDSTNFASIQSLLDSVQMPEGRENKDIVFAGESFQVQNVTVSC